MSVTIATVTLPYAPRSKNYIPGASVAKSGSTNSITYGSTLTVVKTTDSTLPSDDNVFSASRTLLEINNAVTDNVEVEKNPEGISIALEKTVSDGTVIISLKLEDLTPQTVDDGHIVILANNNGELYGENHWVDETI